MNKVSKTDRARLEGFANRLNNAFDEIEQAHTTAVTAIQAHNLAVAKYNEIIDEVVGFGEDIAREIEGYMDERSEAWLDGDKGQAYEEWKDIWDDLGSRLDVMDGIEISDLPQHENADTLLDLPTQPEI